MCTNQTRGGDEILSERGPRSPLTSQKQTWRRHMKKDLGSAHPGKAGGPIETGQFAAERTPKMSSENRMLVDLIATCIYGGTAVTVYHRRGDRPVCSRNSIIARLGLWQSRIRSKFDSRLIDHSGDLIEQVGAVSYQLASRHTEHHTEHRCSMISLKSKTWRQFVESCKAASLRPSSGVWYAQSQDFFFFHIS